jgi:hypothetical protein
MYNFQLPTQKIGIKNCAIITSIDENHQNPFASLTCQRKILGSNPAPSSSQPLIIFAEETTEEQVVVSFLIK